MYDLPKRADYSDTPALLKAWDAGAKVVRRLNKDRRENPHLRGPASHRELVALKDAVVGAEPKIVELGLGHLLNGIVRAQMAKLL